ncbi:MAG: 4-hydroxy-3-methylbut-2-enyl diphosphate reductase, partial [Alphaproteobacteria bacterium]|nr:4-hydroxy-3-methylbut-2-enyl diphosphate reductase [Alphaproteobacteria bacterium]
DATCPLVAKVHQEAQRFASQGRKVVLIGHRGHPEVEGTSGRVGGGVLLVSTVDDAAHLEVADPDKLAYVTQTTLSVDDTRDVIEALRARFPSIVGPDLRDICYATQNRQTAVHKLAERVDVMLVVGSRNSSNSNRLREIGEELTVPSYLIEDAGAIDPDWFAAATTVGITAGASAPEQLVTEVMDRLRSMGRVELEMLDGVTERVQFKLPPELLTATG